MRQLRVLAAEHCWRMGASPVPDTFVPPPALLTHISTEKDLLVKVVVRLAMAE